jgi:hypothetical protein
MPLSELASDDAAFRTALLMSALPVGLRALSAPAELGL